MHKLWLVHRQRKRHTPQYTKIPLYWKKAQAAEHSLHLRIQFFLGAVLYMVLQC